MNRELFGLSLQSLWRRKRSSLLLLSVLFLSFAFSLISLTVTGSMEVTNQEFLFDTYGAWYGAIPSGAAEDEAYLLEQEWLDQLGMCVSYGQVLVSSGEASIGTMDETFLEIGRIGLQDGRFPQSAGEIAMEADLLSALGYSYTLGQEIDLSVGITADDSAVYVHRTFTLVGVLREYTDLWVRSSNNGHVPLNSALITQEDADALYQEAENKAQFGVAALVPQYYFTVIPGSEREISRQLFDYLYNGERVDWNACVNAVAYGGGEADYNAIYGVIILVITMLSIVCIYAVRLQDEARQMSTFRSIGITKRQLCLKLFYETLCLAAPAAVLGLCAAWLGVKALLQLAVYSGSVAIHFYLPVGLLAAAAGVWFLGILIARLAVFLVSLRTPLTGRFHIPQKKSRRYRMLRRGMIVILSALLCGVTVFVGMESLEPMDQIDIVYTQPDYYLETLDTDRMHYGSISKAVAEEITQVPGVEQVVGNAHPQVYLSFDGLEDQILVQWLQEDYQELYKATNSPNYIPWRMPPREDALVVEMAVLTEEAWDEKMDLSFTGVDMEEFRNGDAVVMLFPTDYQGVLQDALLRPVECDAIGAAAKDIGTGMTAGTTVTLGYVSKEGGVDVQTQVKVGGIWRTNPGEQQSRWAAQWHGYWSGNYNGGSYNLLCSEAFWQKMMDMLPEGKTWWMWESGDALGYQYISVYADSAAEYLFTDKALAEMFTGGRGNPYLENFREANLAVRQTAVQELILLLSGGLCIILVLILIISNTLSMEAQWERRTYGIMQSVGMSKRQMFTEQLRKAVSRGALALAMGWVLFSGYVVYTQIQHKAWLEEQSLGTAKYSLIFLIQQEIHMLLNDRGNGVLMSVLVSVGVFLLLLVITWFAKGRLFKDDLMEKLRDEH